MNRPIYRSGQLDAYVAALRARGDLVISRDSMIAEYRRTGSYGEYSGITVSPIGFDQSGGTAAIYCAWSCGNLCGYGVILFFKKEGKKWVPYGEIPIWVS